MKLLFAILIDILDFTIGRLLFLTPFAGEIIGCTIGYLVYGPRALLYALEAIDPTEFADGFVPTMTLIALADQRAKEAAHG